MNKERVLRLLDIATRRVKRGEPIGSLAKSFRALSNENEMTDPFVADILEFLDKKGAEEKAANEQEENQETKENQEEKPQEEKPQEDAIKETEETEESKGEEPESKADEVSPEENKEKVVVHRLKTQDATKRLLRVSREVKERGYPALADSIRIATAQGVVELLNDLLVQEFQQRDLYENYQYYLFGAAGEALQDHIKEHLEDEMEHIETLQRHITSLGGTPTSHRLVVPEVEPLTLEGILQADLALEKEAVASYSAAVSAFEGEEAYTALKVDLEDIVSQEMEHVHDLERWLAEYPRRIAAKTKALAAFLK